MYSSLEAKEIIENIQKLKTGHGLKGLEDPATKKAWEYKNRELDSALQKLSEDLYTKKTHFVMELIQNAEDNAYAPNVQPSIKFSIKPDTLIVYNNEDGFSSEDVEGICSVGQATKSKKKIEGYIGEKGIGFKSVFKVSDSPKIISNGFQFEFRRSDGNNLGYIVPYWLSDIPEDANPQITNIILPLRGDARERLDLFDEIDSALILFLRKLQKIEIIDSVNNLSKAMTKSGSNGLVTVDYQDQCQCWQVIRSMFEVPPAITEQEPRRESITNTEIVLAFPVSDTGSPESIQKCANSDIFAFLPVKKCGLKFIIQADFLLTSNREDILQGNPWNEWLVSKIPKVVIQAIEEFKGDEKLKTTFLKYISSPEEIADEFIEPLTHQIIQAVCDVDCILTGSGSWKKPYDVYYADESLKTLISNDELLDNFGKEYVANTFYLNKELRNLLGIREFTPKCLAECLRKLEWVEKHSDEWLIQLYRFCAHQLKQTGPDNLTQDEIAQLPILKLENGEYWSAKDGKILYYLQKSGKRYGFESDLEGTLRVFDSGIRKAIQTEEDAKDLEEFLRRLSVTYPVPRTIIEEYIVPQYQTGLWRNKTPETLHGHILFIKDNFEKLQETGGCIENIGRNLSLRTNSEQSGSDYKPPRQIYLPDDYGSDHHLVSVMAAAGEMFFHDNSLHKCYIERDLEEVDARRKEILADSKPKKGKRAKKRSQIKQQIEKLEETKRQIVSAWKEFVLALGVREGIIVSLDPETELAEGGSYKNNRVTNKPIYRGDLANTIWKDSRWCDTGYGLYYVEDDYISNDLDRIFHDIDLAEPEQKKRISSMLFQFLLNNWEKYHEYTECKYYARYSGQHGWEFHKTQTTFLLKLRTFPWVTTAGGDLAPLKGLFLNDDKLKKHLGDAVHYIGFPIDERQHAAFIEDVGIRTEISANEIIELIANKIDSQSENIQEFRDLYSRLQEFRPPRLHRTYYLETYREPKLDAVQQAFRNQPLIYIPETDQKYFTAKEIFWDHHHNELIEFLPSLSSWYPECQAFFVDYIDVKETPGSEDLVTVLERIAAREDTANYAKKSVTIYKELNAALKQNPANIYAPWWKNFAGKGLLWVDKEQFWRNDGDVFVNDDPTLYELFADREGIAFLAIDRTEIRDLEDFIKSAKILRLSETVRCDLANDDQQIIEEEFEFAQQIQKIVPYILRYLYHKHPEDYDLLKETQKLDNLRDFRCARLGSINVEYILNDQRVKDCRNVLLDGNTLYISTANQLQIAVEFAKYFGQIDEFDTFICYLLDQKSIENIEEFLESKKIPHLPLDKEEWLNSPRTVESGQQTPEKDPPTADVGENTLGVSPSSANTTEKQPLPKEIPSALNATENTPTPHHGSPSTSTQQRTSADADATTHRKQLGEPETPVRHEYSEKHHKTHSGPPEPENDDAEIVLAKNPESTSLIYITFSPRQRKDLVHDQNRERFPEKFEREGKDSGSEQDTKKKLLQIGHWGEEVVYHNLKREMQNRYPDATISDIEDGFTINVHGASSAEVIWYNKEQDSGDRGHGHDIKIIENGEERYIEVKSSVKPRQTFMVTRNEWDLAKRSGDKYFIYHVYYSPQEGITLCEKIQNPIEKWKKGELEAIIIQIQL